MRRIWQIGLFWLFIATLAYGQQISGGGGGGITASSTDTLTNKTISSATDTVGTGTVLGGVTMTLGSDATGDMYYRNSSGVLTRLGVCTGTNVVGASGGLPACVAQAAGGITVNTTTITSGTTTQLAYDNAGSFGETAGITYGGTGQLTLALGTITTNLTALNITGTWNAAGTTFDAPLFINITNTASNTSSLLADIKAGSTIYQLGSNFNPANTTGGMRMPIGANRRMLYGFGVIGTNATGMSAAASTNLGMVVNGTDYLEWRSNYQFFGSAIGIGWSSTTDPEGTADTFMGRFAAATFRFGDVDAAVPVAQKFKAQSVVGGTAATAGQNWTLIGSLSTGTGTSGDIIFQTGVNPGSGTTQATATTALTIKGETQNVNFGALAVSKGYTVSTLPAGVTGAVAYVTDAVACTFLASLTGGGSTVCPVFYNGTAWVGG